MVSTRGRGGTVTGMTTAFTAADHPYAAGSGAEKLAASGVAPLVGLARGMRTVTPDDAKAILAEHGMAPHSVQGKQVRAAIGETDALWMPWFTPADVVAIANGDVVHTSAPQLRPDPANVVRARNGKPMKYVNLYDVPLVIGPHPATPASWVTTPGRMAFTEGMLKADAMLTALLQRAGASDDDLRVADGEDVDAARVRLRAMLEAVPDDQRILVVGFVSVTTFGKNPEWSYLRAAKDAECWCAFDGDTANNRAVWDQAGRLFDIIRAKGGVPHLLDLSGPAQAAGDPKMGVDDFLAAHGSLDDLLATARPDLPPAPFVEREHTASEWRMDNDKRTTQAWVAGKGPDEQGGWATKHPLVARVATITNKRSLTEAEYDEGQYDANRQVAGETSMVEVEVSWVDPQTNDPVTMTCTGPDDMLVAVPAEWRRIPGTQVPPQVKALPTWPPREVEFLAAMKANEAERTETRPSWDHMGWVPDGRNRMVFAIGQQVIDADGLQATDRGLCAVDNHEVARAEDFGVQVPGSDDEARQAIRDVLDLYRPLDQVLCPWQDPRHASIVLASGLRPFMPLPPRLCVALMGSSGAGKTYTMAAVMAFFSPAPGTWGEDRLPGSASDTAASSEVNMSRTVFWPIDDLPADPDDRKRNAVWELARSAVNGSAKMRRTSTMGAQAVNRPRALLMISAEQAPEDKQSIMNRVIGMRVVKDRFLSESREPTNRLRDSYEGIGWCPQSVVSGFVARMLARRADQGGWRRLLSDVRAAMAEHELVAASTLGADPGAKRQTRGVADLALGLTALRWAVEELGMADELGDRLDDIAEDLYRTAEVNRASAKTIDLGPQVLDAVASVLASHRAHVAALGVAGVPVSAGDFGYHAEANATNDRLGWELPADDKDRAKACGPKIGELVSDADGRLAVLLDPTAAFDAVNTRGQFKANRPSEVWQAVVAARLHHDGWKPRTSGGGAGWKQRVSVGGHGVEGVVVPLWRLMGADGPETVRGGR